jgi:hypothetical protein
MTETEHERKVREYWTRAYDTINNNKDSKLQYEPTAVLTSPTKDKRIRLRLRDIVNLDFSG